MVGRLSRLRADRAGKVASWRDRVVLGRLRRQNPLPRRKVELAQKYGKQLADSVEAVLAAKMQPLGGSWSGVYREVDLPYRGVPSREKLVQDTMSGNKFEANRAKHLLKELEAKGSLRGRYPYPIQVWRLGDLGSDITWVTLGGEVVVDYALPEEGADTRQDLGDGLRQRRDGVHPVAVLGGGRLRRRRHAMIYYGLPSVGSARGGVDRRQCETGREDEPLPLRQPVYRFALAPAAAGAKRQANKRHVEDYFDSILTFGSSTSTFGALDLHALVAGFHFHAGRLRP